MIANDNTCNKTVEGHAICGQKLPCHLHEPKSENRCEKDNLAHAWRNADTMWGMTMLIVSECANCGLKRTRHSQTKEWWSYSDGRDDEEIITMRPV